MSISTIYRVDVTIPEAIYQVYGESEEYLNMYLTAVSDARESGQMRYIGVEVWALFDNEPEARMCMAMLHNMVEHFEGKP